MSALADKIRKARESSIEAGGHSFTIRRPTDAEAASIGDLANNPVDMVARFTVGWNLTELDLIPGGGPDRVAFDVDAFREWVSDQPEVFRALSAAVADAYKAHAEKRAAAAKN